MYAHSLLQVSGMTCNEKRPRRGGAKIGGKCLNLCTGLNKSANIQSLMGMTKTKLGGGGG